jgi:hypothetical protein
LTQHFFLSPQLLLHSPAPASQNAQALTFGQIFACITLYYLFRVRRVSLSNLAKGPARAVDLVVTCLRRMFARHAEPTPRGREAENNKAY